MLKLKNIINSKESSLMLITVFLAGFILTFNKWGVDAFNFAAGAKNLVLAVIVLLISLLIKLIVQKYAAERADFKVEFKPWLLGLMIGVILVFISNGALIFLAFGGLMFNINEMLKRHPKIVFSPTLMGWISMFGPATHVVIAFLTKILSSLNGLQGEVLTQFVTINLWLAAYSILPIPFIHKFKIGSIKEFGTSDGLKLMTAAPVQYVVCLLLIFTDIYAIILLTAVNALTVILLSFLVMFVMYYFFYKQNLTYRVHGEYKYRY